MNHLSENTLFFLICIFFSALGPERNRNVWGVLSFACLLNILLNSAIFNQMDSAWLPVWYGCLECLTIGMLYRFAWNTLGKTQALILGGVWFVHICLFVDVVLGNNLIYANYESVILAAMIAQILLGSNGLFEMARDFCSKLRASLAYFGASVSPRQMGMVRDTIKVASTEGIRER